MNLVFYVFYSHKGWEVSTYVGCKWNPTIWSGTPGYWIIHAHGWHNTTHCFQDNCLAQYATNIQKSALTKIVKLFLFTVVAAYWSQVTPLEISSIAFWRTAESAKSRSPCVPAWANGDKSHWFVMLSLFMMEASTLAQITKNHVNLFLPSECLRFFRRYGPHDWGSHGDYGHIMAHKHWSHCNWILSWKNLELNDHLWPEKLKSHNLRVGLSQWWHQLAPYELGIARLWWIKKQMGQITTMIW